MQLSWVPPSTTICPSLSHRRVFMRFDTETAPRLADAGVIVSRSVEGPMEHRHRRYSTLDWPTHDLLTKAHRMRGKFLRDGTVTLVQSLRSAIAWLSKPDVHRQTVPIPLVEGTEAGRGAVGDQRRRAVNRNRIEDVVTRRA